MRPSVRLEMIDKIGRELQSRFTFDDINVYLSDFDIKEPEHSISIMNSKWLYSKKALRDVPENILIQIAKDLGLSIPHNILKSVRFPQVWRDTRKFRLFISHIATDKAIALRIKKCLKPYSIAGFVAHEDILPTLEWQEEIELALRSMDAFLSIHTLGFSNSTWTQQEIGFALGRDVKIISFKMDEDPTGFISKNQALTRRDRRAEEISQEINGLLSNDILTSEKLSLANQDKVVEL